MNTGDFCRRELKCCLDGCGLFGGLISRFCRFGVFGVFREVSLATFFLSGVFFLFGFEFTETDREKEAVNAFLVAFFEEETETVVGFDPSVQDFLEVGEESGLNGLEFARQELAVDIFLTTLTWAVGQDVGAADFIFANFFVCPGARGGDDVDVVFFADAVAQGAEDFYNRVNNRGVLVVVLPFDDEL